MVMNLQLPQNAGNVACFLPGRAKDLSAPCIRNSFRSKLSFTGNCLSFAEYFVLHLYASWGRYLGLRKSRQQKSWEVYVTRSSMMS